MIKQFIDVSRILLAITVACLAAAIFYLAHTLKSIETNLPNIAEKTQSASESVKIAAEEVRKIIPYIPEILEETRKTREAIPALLSESASIVSEASNAVSQISSIQKTVPDILSESRAIREDLPAVLEQVQASRIALAEATLEIEKVRESLPETLARMDILLDKADNAGKKASEGAISGVLTGLVKAPYSILKGLGGEIFDRDVKVTESDQKLIEEKILLSLNSGTEGKSIAFENRDSKLKGTIETVSIDKRDNRECRIIRIKINSSEDTLNKFCFDPALGWVVSDKL